MESAAGLGDNCVKSYAQLKVGFLQEMRIFGIVDVVFRSEFHHVSCRYPNGDSDGAYADSARRFCPTLCSVNGRSPWPCNFRILLHLRVSPVYTVSTSFPSGSYG